MGFDDVAEPTGRLVSPKVDGDKEEPTSSYRELTSYGDILSPSWIANKGIELAFAAFGAEFSPIDEAKKLLGGNWEEYAACAKAFGSLGKFCDDLSKNIASGNKAMDAAWSGNAADSAFVYFEQLSKDIAEMKDSFDSLKEHYGLVTEAVWHTAEACGDLLSGILDMALLVGITAAIGGSTSFTVFGPVIAAGAVAAEIVEMINLWARLTTLITEVQTFVSGAIGFVVQLSRFHQANMTKFPLPGSGYDNPAA
ncbi:hypothetical protein [Streptomyces sp. NPDC048650]|uniref:hypothetical protein n=1 Tax=unclassified Streptomyces TaxID=2593676 RepID=UPI003721E350